MVSQTHFQQKAIGSCIHDEQQSCGYNDMRVKAHASRYVCTSRVNCG